jgi:DNA-directed RNA polymerase subunit RPC12/RpoP
MERMLCTQCAAVWYSAAAATLVERGEGCPSCGGRLEVMPREPVAVATQAGGPAEEPARRFERDG